MKDNVFTEEINKIVLSSSYDKRMQQLIGQKHMHMEQAKIQSAKRKTLNVTI